MINDLITGLHIVVAGFVACGVLYLVSACALSTRSAAVSTSALDSALEVSYAYDLVAERRLDAPRHQFSLPQAPLPGADPGPSAADPDFSSSSSYVPQQVPVHLSMLAANVAQNKLYAATRVGIFTLSANFTRPGPGQGQPRLAARSTAGPLRLTPGAGRTKPKRPTPAALRGATAAPNAATSNTNTPIHSPLTLIYVSLLLVVLFQTFVQFHRF